MSDEMDSASDIDQYELVDPVNILLKLPNDFYKRVEAKCWIQRNQVLEFLVQTLVLFPKLESGDYGDLVRALKKIISNDTNVMVVATAGKCLAGLANSLKKRFQPYAGACVPALLEKFREKKQNVILALREALDAIFISTTVESIVDDVLEALNNKNRAVKAETAAFLARAFSRCLPSAVNNIMLKTYTGALLKTLHEHDPTVCDNSAEALGTLMKLLGEEAMIPLLNIHRLKMDKIKKCCDKAVIVVQEKTALLDQNNLKNQRIVDEKNLRVLKWNFTTPREEFVELLKDQMATAQVNRRLMANMFHADFRYHLKAIQDLTDYIADNRMALIANLDLILKWLSLRFFDTNQLVLTKSLELLDIVFTILIESEHLLLENEGSSFIPYLILKIGDPNECIRNAVKNIIKKIANLYPSGKIYSFLVNGLESNNVLERAERVDVINFFITKYNDSMVFDLRPQPPSPPSSPPPPPPQTPDNLTCPTCFKIYSTVGTKNRHARTMHL